MNKTGEFVLFILALARQDSYNKPAIGTAGSHQAVTSFPIGGHTRSSAYWSAQSVINLAQHMLDGAKHAYALCRPSEHHAFGEVAGGFYFMNNSAIAAQYLSKRDARVAILDVDVHHRNGTQSIFYDRNDIFTISLNADPARFYPFFWGQGNEYGQGYGFNQNLPLARKTRDEDYLSKLQTALEHIHFFGADTIVIVLGLDAAISDPF